MTQPAHLPIYGKVKFADVSKETLLTFWDEVAAETGVNITYGVRVEAIDARDGRLDVITPGRAISSIACRPCSMALRINPIPPSSPAIKMPSTLDSKSGFTCGRSMPRVCVPNTSVMAPTGHAARHAPCPMHSLGAISSALPRDQAEHIALGARRCARAATNAHDRIDHRVQGRGLMQARFDGFGLARETTRLRAAAQDQIAGHDGDQQRRIPQIMLVERHGRPATGTPSPAAASRNRDCAARSSANAATAFASAWDARSG